MDTPGFKRKKGELLRAWLDFIFGFENKRGDVLDYWISFHDDFKLSPQEFYDRIAAELESRKVPGMKIAKEEFAEGSVLSDKRIYLRLFRERLAIYTCAAPFGIGYFFSCRTVYVPARVRLWHILAATAFFALILRLLVPPLGMTFAIIALIALMFAIAAVFRNAAASSFPDIDSLLLNIPGVATIYEDWFRCDTYWRDDTRTIYLQRIPKLIQQVAEHVTAAKGVQLIEQYRYSPILGKVEKAEPPSLELR